MTARPIRFFLPGVLALAGLGLAACQPTVQVQAPDKPIRIDLNINITQEVRVKIERDLDQLFENNPALFGIDPAPAAE